MAIQLRLSLSREGNMMLAVKYVELMCLGTSIPQGRALRGSFHSCNTGWYTQLLHNMKMAGRNLSVNAAGLYNDF